MTIASTIARASRAYRSFLTQSAQIFHEVIVSHVIQDLVILRVPLWLEVIQQLLLHVISLARGTPQLGENRFVTQPAERLGAALGIDDIEYRGGAQGRCRLLYPLTSEQPPFVSGRKASVAGIVARGL